MQYSVTERQKDISLVQEDGLEETQLIKKSMLGDARALEQLVGRYYDAIHKFCCRRIGNSLSGADACQETFLKMVQFLPRYRERGYFKSWLFAIASNCCNDIFRKKKVTVELSEDIADGKLDLETYVGDAALLKAALDALPLEQKEVVILRYYHDFSTHDVARAQCVPAATVKTRLHRGLKKLRHLLGEEITLET